MFRSKIRTALKRKEQREQGSIAGSIDQQVAMEILSEAPGNQPHREISHLGIVGNCFDILGFQIHCALEAFQVVGVAYVPDCVG